MKQSHRVPFYWCWHWVCFGSILAAAQQGLAPEAQNQRLARAEAATRAGRLEDALAIYREMLRIEPRSGELWSNLGATQAMAGRCEEARAALDRAQSLNPRLFSPWYFAAYCELKAHHDEQALQDLERALEINPRDANAWHLKAQAAADLGRIAEAFRAAVQGLSQNPDEPEGYYRAGKLALDLAAQRYSEVVSPPAASMYARLLEGERDAGQGLWDLAVGGYRRAAALAPADSTVRFALATANLRAGNLGDAERDLRKCLELLRAGHTEERETSWVRARLALVLIEENRVGEASHIVKGLQPARFRAPEEFVEYVAVTSRMGQAATSAEALRGGLERFPDDVQLQELRKAGKENPAATSEGAPTRHDSGAVGLAVRFLAICAPHPANPLADVLRPGLLYRDFVAAFLRDDALTTARLLAAPAARPPAGVAQSFVTGELLQWVSYQLGRHLLTRFAPSDAAQRLSAENLAAAGQPDEALQVYQSLLDRHGPTPDLLRAVAQIHWTQHKWEQALKVLESINQMDPYDATTLVNMGRIYTYQQDLERAEASFGRAAQIEPGMFEAHLGLGETLRRRGEDEAALRELKSAARIEPDNPRPHYSLAQIYRKSQQKDLAAREMEAFERLQARAAAEKPQLVPPD